MCTICGSPHVSDPLGLCIGCAIELRREFYAGLERLNAYLAAWAAFDEWEASQRRHAGRAGGRMLAASAGPSRHPRALDG